ncbi:MAG: sodium:calcium antiporter, partial [Pseudomonadota bacterium]
SLQALSLTFAGLAVILALAGFVIARTGIQIASEFGISQTVVGALLTAVATSLPELVTTIAAVRQGALQLAVGGIVGGNVFDVLFLAVSDAFYRDGPLYTAMAQRDALMIISAILITGVLLLGLIMRDRRGIGIEGYAILIVYASVVALQIGLG